MDLGYILDLISELAYLLGVFALLFLVAFFKGRQAIINAIVGLYLALLISIEFPFYDQMLGGLSGGTDASARLIFFAVVTFLTTMLVYRIMPDEFNETKLESVGKKALLAACATILVMIFSFHVLPVTAFLTPGTPIQSLFAPEQFFFWWLITPLIVLFFHK